MKKACSPSEDLARVTHARIQKSYAEFVDGIDAKDDDANRVARVLVTNLLHSFVACAIGLDIDPEALRDIIEGGVMNGFGRLGKGEGKKL